MPNIKDRHKEEIAKEAISTALQDMKLHYQIKLNNNTKGYFWLDFCKPMRKNNSFKYSVILTYDLDLNILTFIVPSIKRYGKPNKPAKIYKKLNVLNATTIFGSVCLMQHENENVISFRHSLPFINDKKTLKQSLSLVFEYLDFFILEAKNILENSLE